MSRRVKPHQVRGRELEEVREKDPDGRIVYHHRTVDTLGKMLRAGTIDQAMHDAAKSVRKDVIVICHGGPLAGPEDTQYVLSHTKGIAGFYGASSMERLPVEIAITENVKRFKALKTS